MRWFLESAKHGGRARQLRFVSKGQRGALMMCLLCVSAAICLKLPHYVEDQIKCTPGSPGAPFRYSFMPNHGPTTRSRHVRLERSCRPAGRWLNVPQLRRDALLIRSRDKKVQVRRQDSSVHNEQKSEVQGDVYETALHFKVFLMLICCCEVVVFFQE